MTSKLAKDATLHDIRSAPAAKVQFARKVLGVMSQQKQNGGVVVRIGITGTGQLPNYRIEDAAGLPILAIDGNNHKPWPEGAMFDNPENWSSLYMSYADVQEVIASGSKAEVVSST